MDLHVTSDQAFVNLDVIRRVLAEFPGSQVVEFTVGAGAGKLQCAQEDDPTHVAHLAIPRAWLEDVGKAAEVEAATRNLALGITVNAKVAAKSNGH